MLELFYKQILLECNFRNLEDIKSECDVEDKCEEDEETAPYGRFWYLKVIC